MDELTIAPILQALGDPVRLAVVRRLAGVGEPVACGTFDLGIAPSTLTHHLKVLRQAGIVDTTVDGKRRLNSLRRAELDERFPGLLDSILSAADR
jgi:DNA-binding transcriptional ArsR family regulator